MKRKLFSILTALALCLSLCPAPARAAGDDIPSTQAAGTPTRTEQLLLYEMNETTDNTEEGWKWEPKTCTLTLTNCYIKTDKTIVIRFPDSDEVHLVLEGTNVIETSATNFDSIISTAQNGQGKLKVSGSGSMTVTATAAGISEPPYIFNGQTLTIEGGAIHSNIDLCIINQKFTMDDGSVTLAGEYVKHGIYVNAGDVIINGGSLNIDTKIAGMFLPGIPPTTRTNNVKISGGTVNINAPVSAIHINHRENNPVGTEQIEITGGEVNLTANTRAFQGRTITVGENAKLTVQVKGGDGLSVIEGRSVTLAAGTYTGSTNAFNITAADTTLANLLAEGYAFYKGSVSQANLVTDTTGTSLTGTIVVNECVHTPLTSNGNGTHGGKCTACGQSFESESCTYEFTTSGNVHTGKCSVCGSVVKITVTGTDNLVYDGTEQKPTVSVTRDNVELTQDTDYTVTVSGKDAGDVTATIAGAGSYKFEREYTFSVSPKPLTVTGATATGRAYDGTKEVAITAVALDGVLEADKSNVSVNVSNLKATISGAGVGTYESVTLPEMTLTGVAAGNYTLTQPTGAVPATVVISKASYEGLSDVNTSAKAGTTGTYDFTNLLQGIDGAAAGAPTVSGDIFDGTPAVSGKTLSYTLKATATANSTGTITVPVTSTNYQNFNLVVTVTVTDKEVPALTVSPITVAYTGEAVPASAIQGTATVNGQTVTGTWSFAEGQRLTDVADSGAKTVKFTPDEDNYAAVEGTVMVTINKATPTGTPTYTAISAGGKTLADAGLTAPEGWPDGVISWNLPEDTAVTANTRYEWTFTPKDTANYNVLTGSITLWVQNTGGGSSSGNTGSSGGGSGSSGGGGSQTTLPVTTTGQNSAAQTTTTTAVPSASTSGGTATVTVDTSMGSEIVKQAVANDSENVVIAPKVTGSVTRTEVSIPASTVGQLGSRTGASLTVSTPVADVTIPNGGLGSLSSPGGDVTVTAEQLGNRVELTVTAGGRTMEQIPGGLTLTVPAENTAPGTVAVLVNPDGTREVVRKSAADERSVAIPLEGSARLELVDNSKPFADVPGDSWAADAAAFVSARELFSGTAPDRFSPDAPMSRGMLAVVLHNLENNPTQTLTGAFADVDNGQWYAESVSWAAAKGIVSGYGSGQFGPNDNITREQLAVMLWRYAGSPACTNKELRFNDAGEISDFALEAMGWAVENGVINGCGNGQLVPRGLATRAQAAQMLMNFLKTK